KRQAKLYRRWRRHGLRSRKYAIPEKGDNRLRVDRAAQLGKSLGQFNQGPTRFDMREQWRTVLGLVMPAETPGAAVFRGNQRQAGPAGRLHGLRPLCTESGEAFKSSGHLGRRAPGRLGLG